MAKISEDIIRAIIDADDRSRISGDTVRFSLKPHKVFLFDHDTETRIYFGDQTPSASQAEEG